MEPEPRVVEVLPASTAPDGGIGRDSSLLLGTAVARIDKTCDSVKARRQWDPGRIADDVVPREGGTQKPACPVPTAGQGQRNFGQLKQLDAEAEDHGEKRDREQLRARQDERNGEVNRGGIKHVTRALVPGHEAEMNSARDDA